MQNGCNVDIPKLEDIRIVGGFKGNNHLEAESEVTFFPQSQMLTTSKSSLKHSVAVDIELFVTNTTTL